VLAGRRGDRRATGAGSARDDLQITHSSVQIKERNWKINASKMASFCFLLFFRIGTYQWVTVRKNKKISARPRTRGCMSQTHISDRLPPKRASSPRRSSSWVRMGAFLLAGGQARFAVGQLRQWITWLSTYSKEIRHFLLVANNSADVIFIHNGAPRALLAAQREGRPVAFPWRRRQGPCGSARHHEPGRRRQSRPRAIRALSVPTESEPGSNSLF